MILWTSYILWTFEQKFTAQYLKELNVLNSKYLHISHEKNKMAAAYKVSVIIYMVKKETYFY